MSHEGLWTVDEVASFLSMSKSWVYKAAETGTLPCVRVGAALRFVPEDIRGFVSRLRSGGARVLAMR
jgi:excisionase family DNA binding protein